MGQKQSGAALLPFTQTTRIHKARTRWNEVCIRLARGRLEQYWGPPGMGRLVPPILLSQNTLPETMHVDSSQNIETALLFPTNMY